MRLCWEPTLGTAWRYRYIWDAGRQRRFWKEERCRTGSNEKTGRGSQRTIVGREPKSAEKPFQKILTPMHRSRNEVSRMITVMAVGPRISARRSAKA